MVAAVIAAAALAATPTVQIAPGVNMPMVNLGTWQKGNGKPSDPSIGVPVWLKAGGSGLDCAYDYFNQAKVAGAIATAGVPRDQIFITTKVPGLGNAVDLVKADLKELKVDQVDLVLLHMPINVENEWKGLEKALSMNLTRSIGISNFKVSQIEKLMKYATVKPAVNQCSMGVKNHDDATIKYCQDNGITYEAWGTMKGCDFSNPTITSIAANHGKSAAQVCLRYILDRGCVAAVGTGSNTSTVGAYTQEDLDVFDFKLTADEVSKLSAL
eukprot:TRINITY_DN2291_c3_g1_i1.p1 TRINITY_DN2291_c3_g1~~TRINITY_DN2291_c3_g1_i1.p1  ORF type:complete len:289 (+),score=113.83 TRINITY_DN2291_c3_g1_i1:60-869(+)